MAIKKNDNVRILAGRDKGKTGKVVQVLPKIDRVIVEGINTVKKHQRPRKSGQKGQIVDIAMPMHISNVAPADKPAKKEKKAEKKSAKVSAK